MRYLVVLICIIGMGGCTTAPPVALRNPQTGQVGAMCGPLPGLKFAVTLAQKHCVSAYEEAGWLPVQQSSAAAP